MFYKFQVTIALAARQISIRKWLLELEMKKTDPTL